MALREQQLEFGNLHCTFGSKLVLVDMLQEVIAPAVLASNPRYIREYGDTKYFLIDTQLMKLDSERTPNSAALVGRLVKDTVLEREQIYRIGRGLVRDADSLRSSPSSFFVLLLHDHRLLYVRETSHAPSIETFSICFQNIVRQRHSEYINELYESGERKKKELLAECPKPNVRLVPLTSKQGIKTFLRNYEKLKMLEIKLGDRNHDNDNDPFFRRMQERQNDLDSKKTSYIHRNSEGLNKSAAAEEIEDATAFGNQKVKLDGTDGYGDKLRGDNTNFQLKRPLSFETSALSKKTARKLIEIYENTIDDGLINVPKQSKKVLEKISAYVGGQGSGDG